VIAWNYIGDFGTQFGKLSVAYELWGKEKSISSYSLDDLLVLYVRFHEEAEKDSSLEEKAREASKKLEEEDKILRQFWKDVIAITKKSLAELYARLHVSFDLDLGESFYEDKMEPVLQEGIKKKVFKEGEKGALIVEFPEETNMPPYVVRRSDGGTLYSTRDIAQMRYRIDTYHPKAIYILTDVAQKLHFEQLVATCQQLGWELPEFENVLVPRMRFADKSMSTRKGNILELEEVLDEAVKRAESLIQEKASEITGTEREDLADMVGIGAVAYGIVSQNRKMEMVFDWKKILTFEGNSAPYLQYTHARACSVLRKAEAKKEITLKKVSNDISLEKGERDLALTLLRFERVLLMTQKDRMPHILSQYLYELSQAFNAFYHTCPILDATEPVRTLRLFLTSVTTRVLSAGASILTLRVPERM
jgi:arginyl-tRNA synthetase